MVVDLAPGLFRARLGEKPLRLGYPELRPTLLCALLIPQSRNPLSDYPEVDDFRHVEWPTVTGGLCVDRD